MKQHYWHIVETDSNGVPRLGHGDNREVKVGETLTVSGTPEVCVHGLHACHRLIDCLGYASGTVICKVTLGGEIATDPRFPDKVAATERTVTAMTTAEEGGRIMREFACWCALQVAHQWDMPGVVREYLETGNEELRAAAWDAAGDAAWDAAGDAAGAAAGGAAWVAAWAAAWDAAWAAAWAAASAAARAAASAAAWDAAWDAAWAAAWAAASAAYNDKFTAMVEAVFAAKEATE